MKPAGLTEAVRTQAEGNPLFVAALLRLLVQEEELAKEQETRLVADVAWFHVMALRHFG